MILDDVVWQLQEKVNYLMANISNYKDTRMTTSGNLVASRAFGIDYLNDTGKTKFIFIGLNLTSNDAVNFGACNGMVDNLNQQSISIQPVGAAAVVNMTMPLIVPPGSYVKLINASNLLGSASIQSWVESY